MTIWNAALTLFLIMDPLGNLPIFMAILKSVPPARQRLVLIRELLIALGVMLVFLFAGEWLLDFMHLQADTVSIAGGMVMFIIALRMIFPERNTPLAEGDEDDDSGEPFIVPLAIPLIAGPSLLAALILLSNRQPEMLLEWTIAAVGVWLVSSVILLSAPFILRVAGKRALMACERLMGIILIVIAVQMLLDGLTHYLVENLNQVS
ncbi:MAG: YhgN family NAAT transporter [Kistimonas sp.]|nr:YhgN family NAAT transporter [Kistimonas sp.]